MELKPNSIKSWKIDCEWQQEHEITFTLGDIQMFPDEGRLKLSDGEQDWNCQAKFNKCYPTRGFKAWVRRMMNKHSYTYEFTANTMIISGSGN